MQVVAAVVAAMAAVAAVDDEYGVQWRWWGGGVQWRMVAAAFNRNGNGLQIGKQKDGE